MGIRIYCLLILNKCLISLTVEREIFPSLYMQNKVDSLFRVIRGKHKGGKDTSTEKDLLLSLLERLNKTNPKG